jgi:hypothetical protein
VTRSAARLAWYRARVTIRRRVAGYLALAVLVAALPGRQAARTPAAEVLRAE